MSCGVLWVIFIGHPMTFLTSQMTCCIVWLIMNISWIAYFHGGAVHQYLMVITSFPLISIFFFFSFSWYSLRLPIVFNLLFGSEVNVTSP